MRIPQYEQRIIASPAKRTQANIKEPETFRDTSSLNRIAKKMGQTAELAGDVYLDMKKQRDQGIVDEFTNQYNVAKIEKVSELRNQYKGANSTKIVDEFSKWHNDYLATHLGIGQEAGKDTLILENDAQIEGAKRALEDDLPTSINSLSSYAATELNNYRNNQFEGRMYGLQDNISKERNAENLGLYINMVKNGMATHYSGQSSEYVSMQSKKLINSALATNVRNDMATSPELSMLKLQNEVFVENLSGDDINALEKEAVAAFKEKQSIAVAEAGVNGYLIPYNLPAETFESIKPILDRQGGADNILAEIQQSAETKKGSLIKAKQEAGFYRRNDALVNITTAMDVITSSDYSNEDKQKAEENLKYLAEVANTMGPEDKLQLKMLGDINDGVNSYILKKATLKQRLFSTKNSAEELYDVMALEREVAAEEEHIRNDSERVGQIVQQIESGQYGDLLSFNLEGMHAKSKAMIIDTLRTNIKYKKAAFLAQLEGFKLEDQTVAYFKDKYGVNASESPALYSGFAKEFKDVLLTYKNRNKVFPSEKTILTDLAQQASDNLMKKDSVTIALYETSKSAITARKDAKKSYGFASEEKIIDTVITGMKDDVYDELNDDQKKIVVKLLLNGNIYAAKAYVNGGL